MEVQGDCKREYYDNEYWLPHQKFWSRTLILYDSNTVGFTTSYCGLLVNTNTVMQTPSTKS